jgi:hypothetical protein
MTHTKFVNIQPEVKVFAEELGDRLVNAMPLGASSLDLQSRRFSASATLLARHHPRDTADLPFELRALEAALDAVRHKESFPVLFVSCLQG